MKRASDPEELGVVGRYELLFELATGGMGRVFVARQLGDAGFERIVALKRVHPHLVRDPDVYGMASDEARLTALLHHPNIVPVIDVVDTKGELVLVMDYVEGASLASLLRSQEAATPDGNASSEARAIEPAIAVRIVLDTLQGLAHAHSARDLMGEPLSLVHRDVSPQNLLVGVDGTTRVIDFGIARAEGRLTLTKAGIIKGKVLYMAPERLEEGDVDSRADLFSVGAILFELLVSKLAFGAGDEAAQMTRILLGEIDFTPLRTAAPLLAPVVERALARSPRDRFESAEQFARALSEAQPPAEASKVGEFVARLKSTELDRRRERIREAVLRRLALSAEAVDDTVEKRDDTSSSSARAALTEVSEPVAPTARRTPSWVFAAGLAALVLNLVAWVFLTRPSSIVADTAQQKEGPRSSVSAAPSVQSSTAASPSLVDTTARASAEPPLATTGSATSQSAAVPISAGASRPPGLEPSPYGTGLRPSPYKHP